MRRSFTVFLLAVFLSVTAFFPYQDNQKASANPASLTLPAMMGGGGAGGVVLPIAVGLGIAVGGYCLAASVASGSLTCKFGNKSSASPNPNPNNPPTTVFRLWGSEEVAAYYGLGSVYYPSGVEGAAAVTAAASAKGCSVTQRGDGDVVVSARGSCDLSGRLGVASGPYSMFCPSGYSLNNSTALCNLIDASKVPNTTPYDCEIIADIASGNYVTDKNNPACGRPGAVAGAPGSADGSGVTADGTKWRIQGGSVALEDAKGNKAQMTLNPAVPGQGTLETQTPTTVGGNPATKICDYGVQVGNLETTLMSVTCATAPGTNNPDIPQINANASGTATNASGTVKNISNPAQQTDCEIHPTAAGCLDLGDPPKNDIPSDSKPMTFSANPFSLPSGCPAPVTFSAMGRSYSISYQPLCDFAGYIRSLVLISALIAAYFICFGSRREET